MRQSIAIAALIATAASGIAVAQQVRVSPEIKAAVANPARTPANLERD